MITFVSNKVLYGCTADNLFCTFKRQKPQNVITKQTMNINNNYADF